MDGEPMPYSIRIDPKRRVAFIEGRGDNDLASTLAAMDELAALPEFGPGFGMLCDVRENAYTPKSEETRVLAQAFTSRFAGRPMALLVSSLLHYGIANMITTV